MKIDSRIKALVADIANLPRRNGDVDIESMGLTPEEVVGDILKKSNLDIDDLLEPASAELAADLLSESSLKAFGRGFAGGSQFLSAHTMGEAAS